MKRYFFFLIFSILFSSDICSQELISEILEYHWDSNNSEWKYFSRDNWDYNQAGQETSHIHHDVNFSAFILYNETGSRFSYNDQGKIVHKEIINIGQDLWGKSVSDYKYNPENELVELLSTSTHSGDSSFYYTKYVYEKEEAENRRSEKRYRTNNTADNWVLEYLRDSFFNDDGCLIKSTIANFDGDGINYNNRHWLSTYTSDCRLLVHEYWTWDGAQSILVPFTRHHIEYSNNDKTSRDSFFRFKEATNDWELNQIVEKDVDDEGRELRKFVEYYHYEPDYIDTVLILNSYTPKGELEIYRRFKTSHNINDDPLFQIRLDSFSYQYDNEDNMIKREAHIFSYSNPAVITIVNFEYFCNGFLKKETLEREGYSSQKLYTYHGGVNCPLEKQNRSLHVFPNPNDGIFSIQSNLFENADATIQVFTILGKEVFSEKVNQATYLYNLELPANLKGQFIVTVTNDQERASQKLFVQ